VGYFSIHFGGKRGDPPFGEKTSMSFMVQKKGAVPNARTLSLVPANYIYLSIARSSASFVGKDGWSHNLCILRELTCYTDVISDLQDGS
jgi:hypothetical protein